VQVADVEIGKSTFSAKASPDARAMFLTGISVDDAITMIRDKAGRLCSDPSELRCYFDCFDEDGSGLLDSTEMAETLLSWGIPFEEALLKQVSGCSVAAGTTVCPLCLTRRSHKFEFNMQVIDRFDPDHDGELGFFNFTALVSGEDDGTSFESRTT
jgi:hypothetical protein